MAGSVLPLDRFPPPVLPYVPGSGKSLAFMLPVIESMKKDEVDKKIVTR
jgi:hypothetical protein